MRDIQVEATTAGHRLFRNNVGMGWTGKHIMFSRPMSVQVMPGDVLVRHARPLHAGLCEGSSDLIGFSNRGLFMAVEVKTPIGRLTDKQTDFISTVKSFGGISGCCRSISDFRLLNL